MIRRKTQKSPKQLVPRAKHAYARPYVIIYEAYVQSLVQLTPGRACSKPVFLYHGIPSLTVAYSGDSARAM